MKFKPEFYAEALSEVMRDGKKGDVGAIAKRFATLVEKNGDAANFPKIMEAAERFLRAANGDRKIMLASARPLHESAKTLLKGIAKPGDTIEETIDASLIAGVKILVNDEMQFDGSLKAKLEKMFS